MRFAYRYLILCLALVLCLHSVAAAPHAAVRRQDESPPDSSPTPKTRDDASLRPSATPTPSEAASSLKIESDHASSTAAVAVKSSDSPTASTTSHVSTATSADKPTLTNSAAGDSINLLPIQPKLTPAMGISGVLLLLTGLVYAIVGIKNKWVHIFGSAAYLTALAVTVLIVYLMSPPVSNAVQGAFFVAAFVTGVIFGVLALVFSDMTEGFGCLLGGFCLSMWFLSLKEGGLITSATGRAIFIGCMAAAGYSLSFSHYTRNYSLIASIAFSGATAAILGIDCLTGSGWKEFWLYLWNLNDDVFPLDTNTYPMTKSIKAELAGVIIIAAFGIISQMRVWKLVKERRVKSAAQQLERQQDQDREEEALGREIEDKFQKERAQWEAAYGGKGMPESSIRSSITSPKGSTSIREKEFYDHDSLGMVNIPKGEVMRSASKDVTASTTVTVSVLKGDVIQKIDAHGNPITFQDTASTFEVGSDKALPAAPAGAPRPTVIQRISLRPSAPPPPPPVVPLPFIVPTEDALSGDDNSSVSVLPETDHDADFELRPMSKRVSDMSAMRQRLSRDIAASQEALIGSLNVENDRASSVAATLDDDHDVLSIRQLSPPHSPIRTEHERLPNGPDITRQDSEILSNESAKAHTPSYKIEKEAATNTIREEEEEHTPITKYATPSPKVTRQSLTASTDPKADQVPRTQVDTVVSSSKATSGGQKSTSIWSDALSQGSQTEHGNSHVGSLREGALPERLSKVALSYRTNEWAKHLEAADKPDLDDIAVPTSPDVMLADGSDEAPVPVSAEIASPLLVSKRDSRRTSTGGRMHRGSSYGLQRNTSTFSQSSVVNQRSYTQSPSMVSPGIPSPNNSGTRRGVLSPLPSNTLMGQRESLIKHRISSQSIIPHTSSANLLAAQSEQENMTLAQRRQLLQQRSPLSPHLPHQTSDRKAPPSASQKWQKNGLAVKGGAPPGFDSHQPKRTTNSQSDQKREKLYAGWRDTMRDVEPPQTAVYIAEQQRIALFNEKRQKEAEKQHRKMMQQQRASQMDSLMRSGQMMDAHREAMRKMQANANRYA
ncbi:hypothetical protein EJ02DRAFT_405545 [Clathrospora elynae]|uniref:TM7S3/TM198-like domain-containing protein n=1 Tax=Clathrospora elynae TaxID=706981 RepID=A0A6A5SN82_9PLEO|nr:hypothetical protein EJ02DRAFT_405545 [Clathrospora elynae]